MLAVNQLAGRLLFKGCVYITFSIGYHVVLAWLNLKSSTITLPQSLQIEAK